VQNAPYTYNLKSLVDRLISILDRFYTNFFGFCFFILQTLKQQPPNESIPESTTNFKELEGTYTCDQIIKFLPMHIISAWNIATPIVKLRKWRMVVADECLETLYLNEKPNYNTLFGQSEPNRVNRKRGISANIYRIRGKSTNSG
jgi:hypothetical protein